MSVLYHNPKVFSPTHLPRFESSCKHTKVQSRNAITSVAGVSPRFIPKDSYFAVFVPFPSARAGRPCPQCAPRFPFYVPANSALPNSMRLRRRDSKARKVAPRDEPWNVTSRPWRDRPSSGVNGSNPLKSRLPPTQAKRAAFGRARGATLRALKSSLQAKPYSSPLISGSGSSSIFGL